MAGRRQANIKGGRPIEHRVMVSEDQEAQLQAKATALNVTIPKLLVDGAIGAPVASPRVVLAELAGVRRKLTEIRAILAEHPELEERDRRLAELFGKWVEPE